LEPFSGTPQKLISLMRVCPATFSVLRLSLDRFVDCCFSAIFPSVTCLGILTNKVRSGWHL
jgi:hypothetical protein